tara:strand:+ start:526 stop:633 length:108 start_codon:yes stop_codon:yes gene_type:complete
MSDSAALAQQEAFYICRGLYLLEQYANSAQTEEDD